jgi:hypothetical protein
MSETEKEITAIQIQLHIAEYNALTNRCTNVINMQTALLAVAVTWILIFVNLQNSIEYSFKIWWVFLGIVIIGWVKSMLSYELYLMIHYIESFLKKRIKAIIGDVNFWNYEFFLKHKRSKAHILTSEVADVLILSIMFVLLIYYRLPYWEKYDWLGFGVNFLFILIYINKMYSAIN